MAVSIINKIHAIKKLEDDIDSRIWEIFHKFIEDKQQLFSHPDVWKIEDGQYITFYGQDGCMGHYDHMSISIPLEFFEDYDKNMQEDKRRKEEIEREERRRHQEEIEREEKAELKRLKDKYGA